MGPHGKWYDLPCAPKTMKGADPGPTMLWEDGIRRGYNVYPLCGIMEKDI